MRTRDGEAATGTQPAASDGSAVPSATEVLDACLDAIIVIDTRDRIGRANRAASSLFGYPPGGLEGRDLAELIPPEAAGAHRCGMARHLAHGGGPAVGEGDELEGLARDGRRFPLRLSLAEVDEGTGHWYVGVLQDLSAVRAARTERERSLRQLRCIQTLAGHLRQDPPMDDLLRSVGEILPQGLDTPDRAHVHVRVDEHAWRSPEWPATGSDLVAAIEADGSACGELTVRLSDARGPPDAEEHETVNTVATMLGDMMGRRHKARELTRYARELESFSYSVSHDLRAPLRALDGFSRALVERYPEALDERGRDYLQRIRAASQRMSHLIDALLRLSRISRRQMDWAPLDLSALADEIVDELREAEPERAVTVRCERGLRVWGDAALLRIALRNLIGNAWKFTAATEEAVIEVGSDPAHPGRLFVCDNGAGFDGRYVDRLFGAFQRLHAEHEFSGTGIGLVTVKRIVLRHGGSVWAEGEPGAGATFWFELAPARAAVAAREARQGIRATDGGQDEAHPASRG